MNQYIRKYHSLLISEVTPASLGLFRILVGLVLFFQTIYFIATDFVQVNIFDPKIAFKFHYFEFLEPLSPGQMKFLTLVMLVATLGIVFGRLLKICSGVFVLIFTYFWLLDMSYFNNHYYFISLLVLLLFFTNADAWGSFKGKGRKTSVPYYQIFALKSFIFITFFVAGINKLNYYWIVKFQPMKHILETKATVSGASWIDSTFFHAFFSWSGLVFDLCIGFLIWIPKFRKAGIIAFIVFNLLNFWLFHDIGEIGFFPFLLLACLAIFFEPTAVAKKLTWLVPAAPKDQASTKTHISSIAPIIVTLFLLLQLALPFRHFLYEGHVDWNGLGQRFSWRMKLMYKDVDMHFYIQEDGSNEKQEVNVGSFLNDKQYTNLMYYPDFIPPVAKYIREEGKRLGLKNPKVFAEINVGFNGDKKRPLVDPKVDLSKVQYLSGRALYWLKPHK